MQFESQSISLLVNYKMPLVKDYKCQQAVVQVWFCLFCREGDVEKGCELMDILLPKFEQNKIFNAWKSSTTLTCCLLQSDH